MIKTKFPKCPSKGQRAHGVELENSTVVKAHQLQRQNIVAFLLALKPYTQMLKINPVELS